MERIIEKTEDGSATLYVPELDEHYHSTKGAHTESQHIFIDMGLKASAASSPQILEVGFGTGLNAWLTLLEAERSGREVCYTGLELYPLEWSVVEQLNYLSESEQIIINGETLSAIELFKQLHMLPWNEAVRITPHFTLKKVQTDFRSWCTAEEREANTFSVVYFDAFAPEKQPEMWSQNLFDALYRLLSPEGKLTTYCAKGAVRRMLQAAGFVVERLQGPPGGKREILRANKP